MRSQSRKDGLVFKENTSLTRRGLLKGAGAMAASIAMPPLQTERAMASPAGGTAGVSVTTGLSEYMSKAGAQALPPDVVEKAKQHILDTLAAMISGAELPPAQVALNFARACGGEKVATVVGSDLVCGPIEAALANGMLAHSDETDDSHSPSHSHPGCAVVAAALAVGERFGVSGTRFLRAVVLGYDIGTRVTMSLGGLQYQMDSHRSAHSIANTFGASAAAGCAASLSPQQMRWILDYAAQQAAGIAAWQRDTQHVEKSLVFGGFPARNGVTAALLIQLGASGVDDIFVGSDNFFAAFAPSADPAGLVDKLGERFEVTRTNIKKWTVGSPIQAPLDALEIIMKEHAFPLQELDKVFVQIATSGAKTVDNRDMPDISLQHMIAVMLVDGTASFKAAHDKARMQDPTLLAVKSKVELVPDEDLEKLYPQLVAVVVVTLKNGAHYSQRVDAVRGTVRNPMTHDELAAKARDLMTPFLGAEKSDRVIQSVFEIEAMSDVRTLRPLLQRA
jgi:2-methylcitrate dehydratase PrpD